MSISATGPQPWPSNARWLDPAIVPALNIAIVKRALCDILICENPLGSNRSPTIDGYLRRARVPESVIDSNLGYWCAAACGAWWEDCGAEIPAGYAGCVNWVSWAKQVGQWVDPSQMGRYQSLAGFAAVYGTNGTATHIGIIARWDRVDSFISGNTSSNGLSNNGVMVAIHDFYSNNLLGFVKPVARV